MADKVKCPDEAAGPAAPFIVIDHYVCPGHNLFLRKAVPVLVAGAVCLALEGPGDKF